MSKDYLDHEKEWRQYLHAKLEMMDGRLQGLEITAATLKIKVGFISVIFGSIGASIMSIIISLIGK